MTNLQQNLNKNKRRLASFEVTQVDLKKELPLLFKAFHKAVIDFEREISLTPKEARATGLEASLLNSKVRYHIQQSFPENWKLCKYKRFVLRINGYNILIKKLNNQDLPMNIKTNNSEAINYQLSLPLFDMLDVVEPIIYFGYRKDRFGGIINPKLVYVDEGNVRWTMTEDQLIQTTEPITVRIFSGNSEPKLRAEVKKKSVSDN